MPDFFTAATVINTGTSGAVIPLLNGNNTYSGTATFSSTFSSTSINPSFFAGSASNTAVVIGSQNATNGNIVGEIGFQAWNSSNAQVSYGKLRSTIASNTAGSHRGSFTMFLTNAGSDLDITDWNSTGFYPGADNTFGLGSSSLRWSNVYGATIQLGQYTVATLPAGSVSQMAFVTDAVATSITGLGLAPVGGGANKVIVFYDGAWKIL